jgi:hypothetical protein
MLTSDNNYSFIMISVICFYLQAEDIATETLYESCTGAKDDIVTNYVKTGPRVQFSLQAVDHSGW